MKIPDRDPHLAHLAQLVEAVVMGRIVKVTIIVVVEGSDIPIKTHGVQIHDHRTVGVDEEEEVFVRIGRLGVCAVDVILALVVHSIQALHIQIHAGVGRYHKPVGHRDRPVGTLGVARHIDGQRHAGDRFIGACYFQILAGDAAGSAHAGYAAIRFDGQAPARGRDAVDVVFIGQPEGNILLVVYDRPSNGGINAVSQGCRSGSQGVISLHLDLHPVSLKGLPLFSVAVGDGLAVKILQIELPVV